MVSTTMAMAGSFSISPEVLGEPVGERAAGEFPQIQYATDFNGLTGLVGDAAGVFLQNLRHAGAHRSVSHNGNFNHFQSFLSVQQS